MPRITAIPWIGQSRVVRGSGDVVEEARNVSGFTRVVQASVGNVTIDQGEESLRIEAEDNLIPLLEFVVSGRTLRIQTRQAVTIVPTKPINIYITMPEIDGLSVPGLGHIRAGELETGNMSVDISGAGNVDIEQLRADRLDVKISGLGSLSVAGGAVDAQEIGISGSGSYDGLDLPSNEATVRISGLGSARVHVTGTLHATVSGSGSIRYVGNPRVEKRVTGLGNVEPLD
jgi:hypothetical protein